MTIELFLALGLFSVPAFFTPGPNNLMLMASGLNYGVARTMPHMFGVDLGFGLMVAVMGLGLQPVFAAYPAVYPVLKAMGTIYLLYLAWLIATAGMIKDGGSKGQPLSFVQGAAFQWVNPKAWGIAISVITTYVPQESYTFGVVVAALYMALFGVPASFTWVMFGSKLRWLLNKPHYRRWFNIAMALALVASLYPVLSEGFRYLQHLAMQTAII